MQMMLGNFLFDVDDSVAYQSIKRKSSYRYSGHDRVGQQPTLQSLGKGHDDITLTGVAFPEYTDHLPQNSIDNLRDMAAAGRPWLMMGFSHDVFSGETLGWWVIQDIQENGTHLLGGVAQKVDFTLQLRYYSKDPLAEVVNALSV